MKVLFIYPDISTEVINFCPAVHILSSVLKQKGIEVGLIHINKNYGVPYDKNEIIHRAQGYDLYAFTSTSFTYKYANEIAGWLKESNPNILRILGGAHATIQPEDFEGSNFDIFCVGEGEGALVDLTYALQIGADYHGIKNLITRKQHNPVRGFTKDLDSLPFWDFDIMDTEKILEARNGWLSISFSRGCPYECTFCINHLYKKIEIGPNDSMKDYLRRRTAQNTVNELESLAKKYKIKYFNIDDDLLTMDKKWMSEFTTLYRVKIFEPFGIRYVINARADTLKEPMVKMMALSGCKEARIGFETGNEQVRNKMLKKRTSNQDLKEAFETLRKYNVTGVAFAMMGIPGENRCTINDTINAVIDLKPGMMRMTFLFPYKHTEIYNDCVRLGLFKEENIGDNRDMGSPLKFEELTDKALFGFRFLLPWYINARWHNSEMYQDAIDEFMKLPLEVLEKSLPDIIKKDELLSLQCSHSHYRYYRFNQYYFELYEN